MVVCFCFFLFLTGFCLYINFNLFCFAKELRVPSVRLKDHGASHFAEEKIEVCRGWRTCFLV